MKPIRLVSITDEQTGELGLALRDMPRDESTNAANEGLLIAHDIVEHVNGPRHIGTIDDEFQALGAIWYVRGQHNDIRRDGFGGRYSPEENISADVTRMFRDYVSGGAYVDVSPRRSRRCDADEALVDILDIAGKQYLGEFDDSEHEEARSRWPAFRAACLTGMRRGYRKAVAKYEPRGRFAANTLFWAIAEAVRPYVKPEFEGAEYVLSFAGGRVHCSEAYSFE
jgi:hypothetical protein